MGTKREKDEFSPKHQQCFLSPLSRSTEQTPQKLEYVPNYFLCYIQWTGPRSEGTKIGGDEESYWKRICRHDSLAPSISTRSWWYCVTTCFTRGYWNWISWSRIARTSIGRAEGPGERVFILHGKEPKIWSLITFLLDFFANHWSHSWEIRGNRWKRRAGKEWCAGQRKGQKQWKNKSWLRGCSNTALQNPKTRYESDPHGARNSKKEEIFWEEMILNHSNEKKKQIKEFVIVTSRDSFGWLKTMAARHKGKNPTNG